MKKKSSWEWKQLMWYGERMDDKLGDNQLTDLSSIKTESGRLFIIKKSVIEMSHAIQAFF